MKTRLIFLYCAAFGLCNIKAQSPETIIRTVKNAYANSYYYSPYTGNYYYEYDQILAGICFIGIGPALTVSGIVMWAVGQTRIDRINRFNPNGFSLFENEKIQLNLAVGGNSMGLKLNF